MVSAEVKDDNPLNVSDHHPIVFATELDLLAVREETTFTKPSWDKANNPDVLSDYSYRVSNTFW